MGRSARLDTFEQQDSARDFVVFEAIDQVHTFPRRVRLDRQAFGERLGRDPSAGQMGCALSHIEVAADFLEETANLGRGAWLLVTEDDCEFSPAFEDVLEAVLRRPPRVDMILLSNCWASMDTPLPFMPRTSFDMAWTARAMKDTVAGRRRLGEISPRTELGAACYLLSRAGAELLVSHGREGVSWLADDHRLFARWGLRIGAVLPFVAQARPGLVSDITGSPNSDRAAEPGAVSLNGRVRGASTRMVREARLTVRVISRRVDS